MPAYVYDPPERFVAGTVGEPGQRTFFLQARGGGRVTSVALEKQQVAALAQGINEMCDAVMIQDSGATTMPAIAPPDLVDREPLDVPVVEDFRVARLSLAWDPSDGRVVIEAEPPRVDDAEGGEDEAEDADSVEDPNRDRLVVRMSGAVARAFVQRAQAVVSAGRPPCPFCNLPLDPSGHVCPRQNGYRRR